MNTMMTKRRLKQDSKVFCGTGGVSAENQSFGFRPAFRDTQSNRIYWSRFANGQYAPCHLLDGLPDDVVVARDARGRVVAVSPTLVAGFVREGRFYSREEAAQLSRPRSPCMI